MAVTLDALGSLVSYTATSGNYTGLTVGSGSNRVLIVLVSFNTNSILSGDSVTWNGVALNKEVAQYSSPHLQGTVIYSLVNPASGNQTLALSIPGANEFHVIALSFNGVNQSVPCKNTTTITDQVGTTGSLPVTSATGDVAIAVWTQSDDVINSVNNTSAGIDNSGPDLSTAGNYGAGAATVTLTATAGASVNWNASGLDIQAASVVAGGSITINGATLVGVTLLN